MPEIDVLTAERTLEIEANSIVSAAIVAGDFILTKGNGEEINLGVVGVEPDPIEDVHTVASSGAGEVIPDVTVATITRIVLDANCVLTFPDVGAGKSFMLELKQDVTGLRTVTWPSTVRWPGAASPVLTTEGTKRDLFRFTCADGVTWLGEVLGQNYAT